MKFWKHAIDYYVKKTRCSDWENRKIFKIMEWEPIKKKNIPMNISTIQVKAISLYDYWKKL
jgi:hypothetical protein